MHQRLLIICIYIVTGCSSLPRGGPPSNLADLRQQVDSEKYSIPSSSPLAEQVSKSFLIAQRLLGAGKEPLACSYYQKVILAPSPLYYPALLKILSSCQLSLEQLESLWLKHEQQSIPRWAQATYYQQSLLLSEQNELSSWSAKFSAGLSSVTLHHGDRVKLLQRAIELAKQHGMTDELPLMQERLLQLAPRLDDQIDQSNILKIAKDLEIDRKFDLARKYYQRVVDDHHLPLATKVEAYNRLRRSHKKERKRDLYLAATKKMESWLGKKVAANVEGAREFWGECRLNLARGLWTGSHNVQAKQVLYQMILDEIKAARANFILGRIYQEERGYFRAIVHLEEAVRISDNSDDVDLYRWNLAWALMESKDIPHSIEILQQQAERTTDLSIRYRALFWLGILLRRSDSSSLAIAKFKTLMQEDPFGYYGLIAQLQLGQQLYPLPSTTTSPSLPSWTPPTLNWLIAFNQDELAQAFLQHFEPEISGDQQRIESLSLYHLTKFHYGMIRQFYRIAPERRAEIIGEYLAWIFPTPYKDLVKVAAGKFNLSFELIYSIMRQESAFNPLARSPADAFGLLQLTPESAAEVYRAGRKSTIDPDLLYQPKLNIFLGGMMLAQRLKKYNNNLILTVASYNAGATAVRRWQKDRFKGDYLEFIETIPYQETRKYVKLVIRNALNYRRLKGPDASWPVWSEVLR
ncbi:MAG: transglycosylase SLT domain-containing protein [Bdellovibrionales bacterium]|nr:transglycosylase SLT domain-containing protein [Bdellovibrionales bacterium]MBT3524681.1 transglycosylase SLT domain-containing protein [Bdellovibrionales bacterium]MBT7668524.1 transglycosylase SLT domain-containing protein [Bdellovibrionales bacterium]MBT7766282.1 transglycosylase SLT domain-containing protein [Bdellovibrionales bacterium]